MCLSAGGSRQKATVRGSPSAQDGKTWQEVPGGSLDRFFPVVGPACYQYQLKCELQRGGVAARSWRSSTTCRWRRWHCRRWWWARTASPTATRRRGRGRSASRTSGSSVRRPGRRPRPRPSIRADGGESDGTDIVFKWTVPADPDGDAIGDYQFELSQAAGHAVSPVDELLQAEFADAGRPESGDGTRGRHRR